MDLDSVAQEICVELVGQRNRGDRDAGLQASRYRLSLEFGRMATTRPSSRNDNEVCVHVSAKNIVNTMLAAANWFSNKGGLDAYLFDTLQLGAPSFWAWRLGW